MNMEKKIKIDSEFIHSLLDSETVLMNSGKRSFSEGDYEEAIATFNTLIFLKKEHVEAHYFLALSLKRNSELDEAREVYEKVKGIDPQAVTELERETPFFFEQDTTYIVAKARDFALDFIRKHFSEELSLFDILFDVIKDIPSLDQIQTKNLAGALGITGKTDILKEYHSPIIIKSALDTFQGIEDTEEISYQDLVTKFKENLVSLKASKEILSKVDI